MIIKGVNAFKNIHEGEKIFMIGTGPSLTYEMLDQLQGQYTFAMNNIAVAFPYTKWRPYYYLNVSRSLLKYSHWQECATEAAKSAKHTFYWTRNMPHAISLDAPDCPFSFLSCHNYPTFETGCWESISRWGTSMLSALQLAVYMGFDRIYLIACDLGYYELADTEKNFDGSHFDDGYLGPGRREWMLEHRDVLALDEVRTLVAHQLTAMHTVSKGVFVITCSPRLSKIYPYMSFENALKDDGSWIEHQRLRELAGRIP